MADKTRITLLFRNNDNNLRDLWAAISTNSGQSFPNAADIDANNWMVSVCPSSGPEALTYSDSLIAVWMSGAGGSSRVNIATAGFSNLATGINNELYPDVPVNANQNYPKIAGNGDTLGVVWQEIYQGRTVVKALFTVDGPSGLLNAVADTINDPGDLVQRNPDISFYNGDFHITWENVNSKMVLYRKVSVDKVVGLRPISGVRSGIRVFPNPSKGLFSVEIAEEFLDGELVIHDITGKAVYQTTVSESVLIIPESVLAPGIYLLRIGRNNNFSTAKIIRR